MSALASHVRPCLLWLLPTISLLPMFALASPSIELLGCGYTDSDGSGIAFKNDAISQLSFEASVISEGHWLSAGVLDWLVFGAHDCSHVLVFTGCTSR